MEYFIERTDGTRYGKFGIKEEAELEANKRNQDLKTLKSKEEWKVFEVTDPDGGIYFECPECKQIIRINKNMCYMLNRMFEMESDPNVRWDMRLLSSYRKDYNFNQKKIELRLLEEMHPCFALSNASD